MPQSEGPCVPAQQQAAAAPAPLVPAPDPAPSAPPPAAARPALKLSANTLSGSDVQEIVARTMASQASSPGGLMYLWCHALPADVKGRLLQAPDAAFCVAGHVEVVVEDCADGPALMLCFTVPPALARVHTAPHADTGIGSSEGRADPAQQEDKEGPQAALAAPCAFEPFSVTLEPRDADKWVQAAPSPMYRAINAPEVLAA